MIHVGYLSPNDCWDQNIVSLLTSNKLYPTGLEFKRSAGYPNVDGCILVVPGGSWAGHHDTISEAIATYDWVLAFRVSDECDLFDINRVQHPNLRWWVQTPRADKDYGDARLFGCGFPPHFNKLPVNAPAKYLDLFLSAQRTHSRRDQAFDALEQFRINNMILNPTEGFTQGFAVSAYVDAMMRTKVAPAPSGVFSPDSFRLYEALEARAVPIADDVSPQYDSAGYWRMLFPDAPFPILTDYADLPAMVEAALAEWPGNADRIAAWWAQQKRQYALWLREDLEQLGAV